MNTRGNRDAVELLAGNAAYYVASGAAFFLLFIWASYLWTFGWPDADPGTGPAIWGQFGDYVGGLLNSLFSFLSFIALLVSLRLQLKELRLSRLELKLTREEMKESSTAQQTQAAHFEREARKKDHFDAIEYILTRDIIDRDNFIASTTRWQELGWKSFARGLMELDFPTRSIVDRDISGSYDLSTFTKEMKAIRMLDRHCLALQEIFDEAPILKRALERYGDIARRLAETGWVTDFRYLNR